MSTANFVIDNAEKSPEEVRDILTKIHEKGETTEEILDFVRELDKRKIKVNLPSTRNWKVFDVCGTGGSGKTRINISTPLAINLSKKFTIAKHGNRASSGKVGSFDLIEKAGLEISNTPEKVINNLEKHNLAFIFAPAFHPAFKNLAPIRQSIPHATVFNILGPMLNPVEPLTAQIVGVSNQENVKKLAPVAATLNKNILFVHDTIFGLDDVSIGGETFFAKVQNGQIKYGTFVPEDYGITRIQHFEEIKGGNVDTNYQIFHNLINHTATNSQQNFLKLNEIVATEFFQEFI